MTQDLYYYESDYLTPNSGYLVYVADSEAVPFSQFGLAATGNVIKKTNANLTTTFSQSTTTSRIRSNTAALTSQFTLASTISHIEGADLFAMTNAALTASARRIRKTNVYVTSAYTLNADPARVRYYTSAANSSATVSIDQQRVRFSQAAANAAFSLTNIIDRTRNNSADLSSSTQLSTSEQYLRLATADITSLTSLDCDATRIGGGVVVSASGAWASTASLESAVSLVALGQTSLSSQSQLSATISHIEGADLRAFTNSSLTVQADKFVGFVSSQTGQANLTSTAVRIKQSSVDLTTSGSLTAQGRITRPLAAGLNSNFALNSTVLKIQTSAVSLITTGQLTAAVMVAKTTQAVLSSTSTTTATARRTRPSQAGLTSAFTVIAQGLLTNRRPRPSTAVGSAATSNTQKILGSHSLFIPNTSSRLDIASTPDFNIASGQEFLMEFFVYPTNTQLSTTINDLVSYTDSSGNLIWQITASNTSGILFNFRQGAGTGTYTQGEVKTLNGFTSNNIWYWIRVSRYAGTITLTTRSRTAGGVWSGNFNTTSFAYNGAIGASQTGTVSIGKNLGSSTFVGYIDELLIAKDTSAVYDPQFPVSNQTPVELTNGKDTGTQLLMHFNGNFSDDISGIAQAQAALTSRATVTAQAIEVSVGRASLTSTALVTANLSSTKRATANLQVTGSELVVIGKRLASGASLDSAFTLSVANRRLRQSNANLQSAFSLVTNALDLDLASSNLQSAFTVTAQAVKISNSAIALTSSARITCTPTRVYLQLIYSPGNTSGYITSTGTTASAWGTPVHVNFWFSTGQTLTEGQEIVVYRSGSNQIKLRYSYLLPDGSGASQDGQPRYQILVFNQTKWASQNLGSQIWYQRRSSFWYGAVLPAGWNPTQWHNIHMPLSMNSMTQVLDDLGVNTNIEYYTGNLIKIDGQLGTPAHNLTTISAVTQEGQVAGDISPSEYTQPGVSGGQWGETGNPVDLYLDQVWVKTHARTGSTPSNKWNTIPVDDFYSLGNEVPISSGLTKSGLQAQVWLPWGTLLDRSATAPSWNYTANNRVIPGFIVTAQGTWTSTATVVARATRVYQLASQQNSNFTQTTTGLRLKRFVVALTATSQTQTTATKLAQLSSSMSSTSAVTGQALRIKPLSAVLTSRFTQATNAIKVVVTGSALSTQFQQTTNANRRRGLIVNAASAFVVSAAARRTARTSTQMQAFDTVIAVTAYTGRPRMFWETRAEMQINARKIPLINANLTSQAVLQAQGQNTQFGSAGLTAQARVQIIPDYLRRPEARLASNFTQTAQDIRIRFMASSLTATTSQTANLVRVRTNTSSLQAKATLLANNKIIRLGRADLQVTAELLATANRLFRAEAHLLAFDSVLVTGRVINIDPYYQLKIKPEYRLLKIKPESGILTIMSETRVNKIRGYNYDN